MYLIDSDVLIAAKRMHYYAFAFCPGFWDWLDEAFACGRACSVEHVRSELIDYGDELAAWVKERPHFFRPVDEAVSQSMRYVSDWSMKAGYKQSAVEEFLGKADYFLVAHAHAYGYVVVTNERSKRQTPINPMTGQPGSQIKIPEACRGVTVRCMGTFDMLRSERVQFVLKR